MKRSKPYQTERLRQVCRHLLAAGIKPTPTVLSTIERSFISYWYKYQWNEAAQRYDRVVDKIALSHARLTNVRREEFIRAGWWLDETKGYFGRWMPPVKPEVGQRVLVNVYIEDMQFPDVPKLVTVLAVHDSLDESWDPWGEMAWGQSSVDQAVGLYGAWYIIYEDDDGDTGSAASYEMTPPKQA